MRSMTFLIMILAAYLAAVTPDCLTSDAKPIVGQEIAHQRTTTNLQNSRFALTNSLMPKALLLNVINTGFIFLQEIHTEKQETASIDWKKAGILCTVIILAFWVGSKVTELSFNDLFKNNDVPDKVNFGELLCCWIGSFVTATILYLFIHYFYGYKTLFDTITDVINWLCFSVVTTLLQAKISVIWLKHQLKTAKTKGDKPIIDLHGICWVKAVRYWRSQHKPSKIFRTTSWLFIFLISPIFASMLSCLCYLVRSLVSLAVA